MVGQEEGYVTLGVHLIELFESELPQKRINQFAGAPIAQGELPKDVPFEYKLTLTPDYFEPKAKDTFKFPKLMKQLKNENDQAYEARIKNYLLCQGQEQFEKIAAIMDEKDPR